MEKRRFNEKNSLFSGTTSIVSQSKKRLKRIEAKGGLSINKIMAEIDENLARVDGGIAGN